MRNTLFILLLLTFQISFSQKEVEDFNVKKTSIFKANTQENKVIKNNLSKNIFAEITQLELIDFKNNSEGKFSFDKEKKDFFETELKTPQQNFLSVHKTIKKVEINSENIEVNSKKEFVDKVIQKKIDDEIQKYINLNEALTYGDRYLNFYKELADLENKLIISKKLNSDIEVQIGKDTYPYLNKILKTEIDKTLQNSLNLFAINF